jgi:hypothetical protein
VSNGRYLPIGPPINRQSQRPRIASGYRLTDVSGQACAGNTGPCRKLRRSSPIGGYPATRARAVIRRRTTPPPNPSSIALYVGTSLCGGQIPAPTSPLQGMTVGDAATKARNARPPLFHLACTFLHQQPRQPQSLGALPTGENGLRPAGPRLAESPPRGSQTPAQWKKDSLSRLAVVRSSDATDRFVVSLS